MWYTCTSTKPPTLTTKSDTASQRINVEDIQDVQEEPSEYSMFTVNNCVQGSGSNSNLFTVNVLINQQSVGM